MSHALCTQPVVVLLSRSRNPEKKFDARIGKKTVAFGARGMSDYTLHGDAARKDRYLTRHARRENWESSGLRTPGFWSRWLLWNRPSLGASARDMERRFCLHIRKAEKRHQ
jgi:hypothetical protein